MTVEDAAYTSADPRPAPPAEITSTSNARVKAACRLHQARHRRQQGQVLVEGAKLAHAALEAGVELSDLFVTDPDEPLLSWSEAGALVSDAVLAKVATTQNPQGVVAVAEWAPLTEMPDTAQRILVLEGVSDPGNAGTLIRTAAGFGIDAVVLTAGSCDPANPKALRASAGAAFSIPVAVTELATVLDQLAGRDVATIGATATGGEVPEPVGEPWALFVGSEAHGLAEETTERMQHLAEIPLSPAVESLNAAAAGAILLYALTR